MSIKKELLRGNLDVPETEALRAKFSQATRQFKADVPRHVQQELLDECTTSEEVLELFDHLILQGMSVVVILHDIKLHDDETKKLSRRVHYVRARLRREELQKQSQRHLAFIPPSTEVESEKVMSA